MESPKIIGKQILCPFCKEHTRLLKVADAAGFLGVSRRTIYYYIEEGKVYTVKTPGGRYRVCAGCLLKRCW